MLKPHASLLESRAADRLRVGERVVDLPSREVVATDGGEPVRITLKALNVLLTLVTHAGKPVSRETLFEWVWPDTLPTDDVLTQAVTQLRKALGDDRDRPRYIETIAKQGYRLVAPVEWLPESESVSAPPSPRPAPSAADAATTSAASLSDAQSAAHASASPLRTPSTFKSGDAPAVQRRRWVWIAAGAASLAALVMAAVHFGGAPSQRAAGQPAALASADAAGTAPAGEAKTFEFLRIASLPVVEENPNLSPDGALVVYSRRSEAASGGEPTASLVIQTSAATSPRALTEPAQGRRDDWPTWSPDGRWIAFVRDEGDACRVMDVPAAGGTPRELGACIGGEPHPLSWYPDGSALIGASRPVQTRRVGDDKALYRMPLATGRWERIQYAKSPSDEDMSPAVSPDGRWIAFHRNVSLGDLWRMPVTGGTPERLTRLRTNLYGLAWTPDGRHLVFSRYVDGKVTLSSLDLDTRRVVDFRAGSDDVTYPNIARNAGTLVFEAAHTRSLARRLNPADGAKAMQRSRVLFESSGSNMLPSPSPDGRQILFVSDRTGDVRLWWAEIDRPDSLRSFEGFTPIARYPSEWRADSQAALVVGRDSSGIYGLFEIDAAAGRVSRLPLLGGEPVFAAYHPEPGRLLVVADLGEGRLGLTLYDRTATPWRALAEVDDVSKVAVDGRNRRIVMASMSSPAIRSADFALQHVATVDRAATQRRNRAIVATPAGVMVMDMAECPLYWRPVALAEGRPVVGHCLGGKSPWLEGVSVSQAADAVYLSSTDELQIDIGVAPLSRVVPQAGSAAAQPVARH